MNQNPDRNPRRCFQCRYFYITWDPIFPYGCRAMGFKSKKQPSVVVFSSSGLTCLRFEPKNASPKEGT